MKRILSLTLALLMMIPMIAAALPQFSFADSTQLAETTDGYASYIYYSGGIRAKSDKSILFSPYMTDVKAAVTAGASLTDYTVKMTFSLLSGEDGEEIFTFDTVSAALNASNGQYYDIYLNGAKGNSGFCPTAGCYYNVYVEIVTGFGTESEAVAFHGTYKNAYAADAIANSTAYYFPTSTAKEMSETGEGSGLRKKSDGRIMFSPAMADLRAEVAAGKAYEDFTVKATFSLLGEDDT
ncbi:MAG: hypothetical protein IJY89_05215, partial [Clostridia bacterium]|nr:hypothetical protein [Clostridia bacterium]